ncbi:MAG: UDP-N-acetylglucosamine 2-epimerase (non-hydrolyzing) [Candidatus Thermoplasmatota archaeon]|nr:UDP-N-acetylglucosamine 2-epimerase (non-hydrolyzing) [Candidatus Thermoplasmatota archaeon]
MKIAVVLGTRPEIIKMSPLIRQLENSELEYDMIHTGQHYDEEVSGIFFDQLEISRPDKYLGVGSGSQAEQTGEAMIELERAFQKLDTELVLVEGDTNTVLAGALAGIKMGLEVGHIEAGLRSYDYRMPEEYNRRLTDHSSNLLFAPTEKSKEILKGEDIWGDVFVTGNTVIDACIQNMEIAEQKADFDFELPEKFVLLTAHRAENVDDPKVQENFIETFEEIRYPMIYPIHPRAEEQFKEHGNLKRLEGVEGMKLVPPQGYLEFLMLMKRCEFIMTDSGGIQEEATAPNIRKKVFVLRRSTERPEAVEAGYSTVVGTEKEKILEEVKSFDEENWDPEGCPYGDGNASKKIVEILEKR